MYIYIYTHIILHIYTYIYVCVCACIYIYNASLSLTQSVNPAVKFSFSLFLSLCPNLALLFPAFLVFSLILVFDVKSVHVFDLNVYTLRQRNNHLHSGIAVILGRIALFLGFVLLFRRMLNTCLDASHFSCSSIMCLITGRYH